jgi:hypothetical protein
VGPELTRAAVRLEPYLGGNALEPELGRRWDAAARHALDELAPPEIARVSQQAEALLVDLRAGDFLASSTVLPGAYARRIERFAGALRGYVANEVDADAVAHAFAEVREHREGARSSERGERLEMALRLVRYLESRKEGGTSAAVAGGTVGKAGAAAASQAGDGSLGNLARRYTTDSSFADWARVRLLGGESEAALAGAFSALLTRVAEVREVENRAFGHALAEWSRRPYSTGDVVPIEHVLERVVAPLAETVPVLVVLLDGMDHVVFRQLREALHGQGWEEWLRDGTEAAPVGVAVVPSLTTYSRTSLFAGQVMSGIAGDERRHFAAHPALGAVSRAKRLPLLFHKGDIGDSASGLAEPVRQAIADPEQRVLAVVLNAVDDFLAKSDQVRPRWTPVQI